MNSRIVRYLKTLGIKFHQFRGRVELSPGAHRSVSKDDLYDALIRQERLPDHLGVFEDRNGVEFWMATDPESFVTSVMLPEEYRS
jgi:hypothetical protein